jgi:6-phosphogluconolactonase
MTNASICAAETADQLVQEVLASFIRLAKEAIEARGIFRVSLSGGSTPKRLYEEIAKSDLDFSRIQWFWGDERNVPHEHSDSNFRMVNEALLRPAEISAANVFPVPVDVGNPAAAASDYEATLRHEFGVDEPVHGSPSDPMDFPQWDLVLLGLGDDAHTASLFPETSALDIGDRWFVENWVEKFSAYRYTLTAPAINSGREIWFLISGSGKKAAVGKILGNDRNIRLFPSQLIRPTRFFVTSDALPEGQSV